MLRKEPKVGGGTQKYSVESMGQRDGGALEMNQRGVVQQFQ